jgi:exopolysaccharide biosynthesis polyprenyl glycosylphosphotransferase
MLTALQWPSSRLHAGARRHRRNVPRRGLNPRARATNPHVVAENLFKGVLIRERRRADRSNEQLLLISISTTQAASERASIWSAVFNVVNECTRESDVTGWLENGRTVGVIISGVRRSGAGVAPRVQARVLGALARRLTARLLGMIAVGVSVHHGHVEPEAEAHRPMPGLDYEAYTPRWYGVLKRALDIVASLALILVMLPVFLVVALLVKLTSRGPVFFRQIRIGYQGRPFTMLKFRTMRVNVDHKLHQEFVTNFIKSAATAKTTDEPIFKIARDPRVTTVGRILRKTSLDELPQFWNVLRGEMSLVGPRPPLPYEVEHYESWHRRRVFEAKPGVTGLWQVTGRSRTTFDDMVRLDLRYVKTCSLSTDLKILLATPAAVITGKGAC